jgi:hypothetical protein
LSHDEDKGVANSGVKANNCSGGFVDKLLDGWEFGLSGTYGDIFI